MNEQELKADFQMPQSGGGGWRVVKSNYRGAWGQFGGGRYVHCLYCSDDFKDVYICQNIILFTLNLGS